MGNTIWLELTDVDTLPAGSGRDNSTMLDLQDQLDTLAERLGVTKLSAFFDYSALEEDFSEELAEAGLPAASPERAWFDSRQGLATIDALLEELRARPESLGFRPDGRRKEWPRAVLDDLAYCSAGLRAAVARSAEFSFRIIS